MIDWFTPQRTLQVASAALVSLTLWMSPSLAQDPFRTANARPISDRTEAAFRAFFEQGNYTAAANYLQQSDARDPLAIGMKASLAYLNWQGEKDAQKKEALLEEFRGYGEQTRNAAQQMLGQDPLRGNLYLAVSHFLSGAYVITKEGTVKGTPQVLLELKQVFQYLDAAEAIAPNDPELNLIKGYVDLFTSLNLPFSSPTDAIERLEKNAAPRHLVDRGLALGYRELNDQTKAMEAVDRALKATPDNPELLYLKAQILVRQGKNQDGLTYFEKALKKQDQLPAILVKQISREMSRTQRRLGTTAPQ